MNDLSYSGNDSVLQIIIIIYYRLLLFIIWKKWVNFMNAFWTTFLNYSF